MQDQTTLWHGHAPAIIPQTEAQAPTFPRIRPLTVQWLFFVLPHPSSDLREDFLVPPGHLLWLSGIYSPELSPPICCNYQGVL